MSMGREMMAQGIGVFVDNFKKMYHNEREI